MKVILGAGIAGLSAGYHYSLHGIESRIFEKNLAYGGLCSSFEVDGFRFDHGPHFSFTKSEYVRGLFASSCEFLTHKPLILNYYHGRWIKHPAQSNIFPLSSDEKAKIISDFTKRTKQGLTSDNYEDWLRAQYGDYFAEHFPLAYTKKYWTIPARQMTTDWIANRMHIPNLEEVLRGATSADTGYAYYAEEMRYPCNGGYQSFLTPLVDKCNISFSHQAALIEPKRGLVEFTNGQRVHYQSLISSLPLPELIGLIPDAPTAVTDACAQLLCSSVALVSLGIKGSYPLKSLFSYIYDEDILPARFHSPSLKSENNAPIGCYSLQFETYFSKYKPLNMNAEILTEHSIEKAEKMGLLSRNDVVASSHREIKYANVVFDHNRKQALQTVLDYLKSVGIRSVGRFGQWAYFWSDQSLLSAKQAVEEDLENGVAI